MTLQTYLEVTDPYLLMRERGIVMADEALYLHQIDELLAVLNDFIIMKRCYPYNGVNSASNQAWIRKAEHLENWLRGQRMGVYDSIHNQKN